MDGDILWDGVSEPVLWKAEDVRRISFRLGIALNDEELATMTASSSALLG